MLYQFGQETFRHFDDEFVSIRDEHIRMDVRTTEAIRKPRTFQVLLIYLCIQHMIVRNSERITLILFKESAKSQKTVESLIISRPGDDKRGKKKHDEKKKKKMEETKMQVTSK
uniref:Uncharacterized protein n=1 Tax=Heterorhabditis bacteriophora TaxID=37862 RepID=A0A1I7WU02_HETBA